MSDILKVSVPTTGYENSTRTNPISVQDTNISNIVDPSKVTRADGQSDQSDHTLTFNYESNFDAFVAALRKQPDVIEMFSQIFFRMGMMVESGIGADFAQEIGKFMDMVSMTPEELLKFLKNQVASSGKFEGAFFQQLQTLLNQTKSAELQREILQFLKTYNSVDSTASTMKNMQNILQNMTKYMTSHFRTPLEQMTARLQQHTGANAWQGAIPANIALLKKEILPFLSNYIKQTNDMGKVRDMITMLTLNIAKYENGSMGRLVESFERLTSFQDFGRMFGSLNTDDLRQILLQKNGQAYAEQFVSMLEHGLKGEGGFETKQVFQNIMQALLLNESVYMPLKHLMLPVNLMGQMMFSEIWIDPKQKKRNENGSITESQKLLIKFDIQGLGFFDLIMMVENKNIDMQMYFPEALRGKEKILQKDMGDLMEKNGFHLRTSLFTKAIKPKKISEVFPQIYERKNAINVKI